MNQRFTLGATVILLGAGLVAPAEATPPSPETITLVRARPGGPEAGWSASGFFTDSGEWVTDRVVGSFPPQTAEGAFNFFITATNEEGDEIKLRFLLEGNARHPSQEQQLCWVTGGSGVYEGLHGHGTFTFTFTGPNSPVLIECHLEGAIH